MLKSLLVGKSVKDNCLNEITIFFSYLDHALKNIHFHLFGLIRKFVEVFVLERKTKLGKETSLIR